MRDRPNGPELLWQARRVVLDELLPHLPEDKRYDALMVAAAMATAAREAEAGDAPLRRAHAALTRVLGGSRQPPADPAALAQGVAADLRRLAATVRDGEHDADPEVHAVLQELARERLRESNPKHLKARGDQ